MIYRVTDRKPHKSVPYVLLYCPSSLIIFLISSPQIFFFLNMLDFLVYVAMFYYIFLLACPFHWLRGHFDIFLTPCLALYVKHYMIQTDLSILLCMCFCTNHPLIPNQLLRWRFYRAPHPSIHARTHTQTALPFFSCLINPVVHCCFLFWGHKPLTLAEMKGLPCAPNKACTFGPSHCLLWGFSKHTCRPSGAVRDRREQRGGGRQRVAPGLALSHGRLVGPVTEKVPAGRGVAHLVHISMKA